MTTLRDLLASRPSRAALAAFAALALLAASCGGDEPAAPADTSAEGSSTTQAPEGTGSDDADDADDADDDPAVVAELEQMSLEVSDLPAGWSAAPDDDDDDDDPADDGSDMAEDCGMEGDLLPDDVEPLGEVEREFQKDDLGPFFFVSVTRFDRGEAETAMAAIDSLVEQCSTFSSVEDGVETSGTMEPLSFPAQGDQTSAVRMTIATEGMSGQGDIIAVRQGDDVVLVLGLSMSTFLGDAPFGAGEFDALVTTAVDKAFG